MSDRNTQVCHSVVMTHEQSWLPVYLCILYSYMGNWSTIAVALYFVGYPLSLLSNLPDGFVYDRASIASLKIKTITRHT